MKTRRTIKGTSAGGVVEEAYTPSNPPPYPVVTNGNYPNMTVGKATNADNATNATNATNIIPDSNGAVNPGGRGEGTVGNFSTALGNGASAIGTSSTALGRGASAAGNDSIALGREASAIGTSSTALGRGASATNASSTALGNGASATGQSSIALGREASAIGTSSIALGREASVSGDYSTALGYNASAIGTYSTALGRASAAGESSIALGYNASASGDYSTALGYSANVSIVESNVMQLGGSALSVLRSKVNLTVTSDERDKADINNITNALPFLEKLNPVTFVSNERTNYISEADKKSETYRKYGMCDYNRLAHALGTKKGERRRCGLLAQEVVAAMQEVYGTDNYANIVNDNFHDLQEKPTDVENKYTLAYANLVPFLIGAIKELKKEFNAKIKSLEDKLK